MCVGPGAPGVFAPLTPAGWAQAAWQCDAVGSARPLGRWGQAHLQRALADLHGGRPLQAELALLGRRLQVAGTGGPPCQLGLVWSVGHHAQLGCLAGAAIPSSTGSPAGARRTWSSWGRACIRCGRLAASGGCRWPGRSPVPGASCWAPGRSCRGPRCRARSSGRRGGPCRRGRCCRRGRRRARGLRGRAGEPAGRVRAR